MRSRGFRISPALVQPYTEEETIHLINPAVKTLSIFRAGKLGDVGATAPRGHGSTWDQSENGSTSTPQRLGAATTIALGPVKSGVSQSQSAH
jgi:hypothetical protein